VQQKRYNVRRLPAIVLRLGEKESISLGCNRSTYTTEWHGGGTSMRTGKRDEVLDLLDAFKSVTCAWRIE
jgi:hypothetical protein